MMMMMMMMMMMTIVKFLYGTYHFFCFLAVCLLFMMNKDVHKKLLDFKIPLPSMPLRITKLSLPTVATSFECYLN